MAVGALFPDDPDDIKGATGAIWTSPDGIAWDRQPVPNAARDGNTLLAVGVGPGGVVAGGIGLHSQSTDAVLLTSSDGAAWQSAKAPGLADDQDEEIFRVVATSQRWLVTGRVSPPKCRVTGCITQRGRVWNSADLNSWESVDVGANPPGVFGSDDTAFFAVANEGDGFQVGSSPDGRAWSPVTPILSLPDGVIPGGWLQFDGSFMIVAITVEPDQRIVAWRIT